MTRSHGIWLALLSLLFIDAARSQNSSTYQSLVYPRSIMSAGMGEQGAAMMNAADALQYNPANLVHTGDASASFFRNPFRMVNWPGMSKAPVTSVAASFTLSHTVSIGIEYTNWTLGQLRRTTEEQPGGTDETFTMFERSIAAAVALPLGADWAVGAQMRCAWQPIAYNDLSNDLLFSAGVSYMPSALSKRAAFGLSLMNFGNAVRYDNATGVQLEQTSPLPAQIDLAADYAVVRQRSFDLRLTLGFTKPLDESDEGPTYAARSSFASMWTNWKDFPRDVTTHLGLGYVWKPLPLGRGMAYFQEMYLGYFTVGPSSFYNSFFTHGVRAGVDVHGVKVSAGYAGRWHNNHIGSYLPWTYPWETFHIMVSANESSESGDRLHGILVSLGSAYCSAAGRSIESALTGADGKISPHALWSLESDFYLTPDAALTASLSYARLKRESRITPLGVRGILPVDARIETAALDAGCRYHPLAMLRGFFLQASLGLVWMNPIERTAVPRYRYAAFDHLAAGWTIPLGATGLTVVPKAGLTTTFMESAPRANGIAAYHRFEFGLNVGHMF